MSDFNPDEFLAQAGMGVKQEPVLDSGGFDPDSFIADAEKEQYGTPIQQIKAGLEGIAKGFAGPAATLAETKLLGVEPEAIRAREESNPLTHGIGEAVGLGTGLLTGTGEAAIMTKVGQAAADLSGLGKVAENASLGFKVGHEAVKQAAEMAVLQSGDEVSKMILKDPSASAENAIASVGLSAALGGLGGAAMTGIVSPLWKATAGPKVESLLTSLQSHLNGRALVIPEAVDAATKELGVELQPVIKAATSGHPNAVEQFNTLKYAQNPHVMEAIEKTQNDVSHKVMDSLGIPLQEAQVYSKAEAGNELLNTFKKEYKVKYEPLEQAFEKRNAEAAKISLSDDSRLDQYGRMLENGMQKFSANSPYYKEYEKYGQRLLDEESIGGIDKLKTEIGGEIDKAIRANDTNNLHVLRDIRSSLSDFQEAQILKQASEIDKPIYKRSKAPVNFVEGEGTKMAQDLLNERAEANRSYKEFAQMSNELLDNLGSGRFSGSGGLLRKLDGAGAEQLLNKFSVKNNADFIPFLEKNFPETLQHVQQNELKDLIKPAIKNAKGENPVDINTLERILKDKMAGKKELVELALPAGAIQKIEAAKTILDAIPKTRDSGTPGGMSKLLAQMPASAMAGLAMFLGHNPVAGALIGEMSQKLGRDVPDAIRLGYLKFLASDMPIKSEGFKSMVDFFHNTYVGENLLSKASKAIFKSSAQVAASKIADTEKLDKVVTKYQDNPEAFLKREEALGHYLPQHQQAMSESSTRAIQYLEKLKPRPYRSSPLDKEIEPTAAEKTRYDRALQIAQQPVSILEKVKNGTILPSDIQDLTAMYPALYRQMSEKISNDLISHKETLPYATKMGLSLFLGQPLDSSMKPDSILSAQPISNNPQLPPVKPRKGTSAIGKNISSYMTQNQAASAMKLKH